MMELERDLRHLSEDISGRQAFGMKATLAMKEQAKAAQQKALALINGEKSHG